ncbi:unnamed protein product [Somion occarium]|uniref:Uncharacterized protein n=1 Tax=Somion occarium TaxID=3059160 RepID=A0ABP1DHA4_9APHY
MLDVKKTLKGELESYRMRIVWSINPEQDAMDVDHREVVFEDIDLLSFSSPDTVRNLGYAGSTDPGLPLKAVYRDCVVGIRYLHPRIVPAGQSPVYRRIQVNFKVAKDAASFIDAVRQVCPCKANPPPAQGRAMTMANNTSTATSVDMPPPPHPRPRMPASATASTLTANPVRAVKPPVRASTILDGSIQSEQHAMSVSALLNPLDNPTTTLIPIAPMEPFRTRPSLDSAISLPSDFAFTSQLVTPALSVDGSSSLVPLVTPSHTHTILVQSAPEAHVDPTSFSNVEIHSSDGSGLSSSHPSSSATTDSSTALTPVQSQLNMPSTAVSNATFEAPHAELLDSLREIPELYNLPMKDLEKLIAQIIREDGFIPLLEKLDSMWRIKGFLALD